MLQLFYVIAIFVTTGSNADTKGLLYPRDTETREVKNLDGIWRFVKSNINDPGAGVRDEWYLKDLGDGRPTIPIAVPSSYNDLFETVEFRDHVGTVWYERYTQIPASWSRDKRVWIRFGSVHYRATVWINGKLVVTHELGHLPFEKDITDVVRFGEENRITVECDNSLLYASIPHGQINNMPGDDGTFLLQTHTLDFFNYAGIQRSVYLYTTPSIYLEDIYIRTDVIDGTIGRVHYDITYGGGISIPVKAIVQIKDKQGKVVASQTAETELSGYIDVANANLWWPYLMSSDPGYLYTLDVTLLTSLQNVIDIYRKKFGIRSLVWNNEQILINGKPIYFRGFGKHEDSNIRGKGLDYPLLTKDFSLIKWIGANTYRTSHYPYSEESMEFADEQGIMIIDECNAGNIEHFTEEVLETHKSALEQLIHRDRSHPSVILWSIANEPRALQDAANDYFRQIAEHTHLLDPYRPLTGAINTNYDDNMAPYLDVISFNRYNGWYEHSGNLQMIIKAVVDEATEWNRKYNVPVIVSEYGADSIAGLHILPSFVWTEDYQRELYTRHFQAFDILRESGKFFLGEFIWNFADFKTNQALHKVGGNTKGIFTRQRQPKAGARLVRQRYFGLSKELDNLTSFPSDLDQYVIAKKK